VPAPGAEPVNSSEKHGVPNFSYELSALHTKTVPQPGEASAKIMW
jgi:hypothetical protein